MKLYDHDSCRAQFTETVYDLLASDPDNDRANRIIAAFDDVPAMEAMPVEIPFEELTTMERRSVYVVCWDDPDQSGWAVLYIEKIFDTLVLQLRFLDRSRRYVHLTESNYRHPWVLCYREPVPAQACVFVSGERYRRLKADYDALKQELDTLKAEYSEKLGTA